MPIETPLAVGPFHADGNNIHPPSGSNSQAGKTNTTPMNKHDDPDTDYVIGLSPRMQDRHTSQHVCELIERTLSGDPGDSDDPENLMHTVSALLDDQPSIRIYRQEKTPAIIAMFRPDDLRMLFVHEDELIDPKVIQIIRDFGFNGRTLLPLG